jgi:hypothetical protein
MLLAGAEEAAKEAVETWLKLYEDDQRALREYMQEGKPAAPGSSTVAIGCATPAKRDGGNYRDDGCRAPTPERGRLLRFLHSPFSAGAQSGRLMADPGGPTRPERRGHAAETARRAPRTR